MLPFCTPAGNRLMRLKRMQQRAEDEPCGVLSQQQGSVSGNELNMPHVENN